MFETIIKPLTAWLHMHPHWAGFITFIISFSESLAIVGTIVPGSVTMTAIGILVGSGVIDALPTFVFATLGAIAGDSASFWLGRHYHQEIKSLWPFRKYPGLFVIGESFFKKHGGKSVFIGRFAGPVRSIIPVIAGMMNMRSRDFVIANVTSAIGWSIGHIAPGIFIGAAALELSSEAATRFMIIVLGLLVGVWLGTWLLKWVSLKLIRKSNLWLDSVWQFLRSHPRLVWLTRLMQDAAKPDSHRQFILFTNIILCSLSLLALIFMVNHQIGITALNEPLYYLFQSIRTPRLDNFFVFTTFFAEHEVLFGVMGVGALYFLVMRQWKVLAHWIFNSGLVIFLTRALKFAIDYPRPSNVTILRPTASFPSGHVTIFTAILAFTAYLIARELPEGTRRNVYLPVVFFILLEIIARLYLGAHWFTDILGSLLIGCLCAMLTILSFQRLEMPRVRPLVFFGVCAMTLLAGWMWFTPYHFSEQIHAYTPQFPIKHLTKRHWWLQSKPVLPVMRQNRLGRPVSPLNIQYAGELDHLILSLVQQGWEQEGSSSFFATVNRITAKDKSQLPPAISQLYHNQKPIVTLTKKINDKPLLIFHIWRSGATFTDSETPLWIGSVGFREVWHYQWHKSDKAAVKDLPNPIELLLPNLTTFRTRQLHYAQEDEWITVLLLKQ